MRSCRCLNSIISIVSVWTLQFQPLRAQPQESPDAIYAKAEAADKRKDYASQLKTCTALAALKDVRGYDCLGGIYNEGVPGIPATAGSGLKRCRLLNNADGPIQKPLHLGVGREEICPMHVGISIVFDVGDVGVGGRVKP